MRIATISSKITGVVVSNDGSCALVKMSDGAERYFSRPYPLMQFDEKDKLVFKVGAKISVNRRHVERRD
jgi:hypothetical protein